MKILREKSETVYAWKRIHLNRSRILIFIMLLSLAFMLFIMNIFPYSSVGVVMIPLAYGLGIFSYKKLLIWDAGTEGQKAVTHQLKGLDDNYFLINSVVIPPNRGDTDHIILGPTGIFVFETKNLSGVVECNHDVWNRYKVSGKGKQYHIRMGSPSNQAKRNAKVLKDFILKHKKSIFARNPPHIWVNAAIVFASDKLELKLKDPTVDVLKIQDLMDYIKKQRETPLSAQEIERASKFILEYTT